MSATIIQFPRPLQVEETEADFLSIPTIAQSVRSMCFRKAETRIDILRSCLCIAEVSNAAIRRDEVWEGDELLGYIWRFSDNSILTITVDHDWAV